MSSHLTMGTRLVACNNIIICAGPSGDAENGQNEKHHIGCFDLVVLQDLHALIERYVGQAKAY